MAYYESIVCILHAQLKEINSFSIRSQIEQLLIAPRLEHRAWDYGSVCETFPCWFVLEHHKSNTGIAYCELGFGPRHPWGLMFLAGQHSSMGSDASWYPRFIEAFTDSMAYKEDAEQPVDSNPH